jgi:hypothetical protein
VGWQAVATIKRAGIVIDLKYVVAEKMILKESLRKMI